MYPPTGLKGKPLGNHLDNFFLLFRFVPPSRFRKNCLHRLLDPSVLLHPQLSLPGNEVSVMPKR